MATDGYEEDEIDAELLRQVESRSVSANVELAIEYAEQYWHRHGGEELEELRAILQHLGKLAGAGSSEATLVTSSGLVEWANLEARFTNILIGVYLPAEVKEDVARLRRQFADSEAAGEPTQFHKLDYAFTEIFGELEDELFARLRSALLECSGSAPAK